jgi:hypothetical protein
MKMRHSWKIAAALLIIFRVFASSLRADDSELARVKWHWDSFPVFIFDVTRGTRLYTANVPALKGQFLNDSAQLSNLAAEPLDAFTFVRLAPEGDRRTNLESGDWVMIVSSSIGQSLNITIPKKAMYFPVSALGVTPQFDEYPSNVNLTSRSLAETPDDLKPMLFKIFRLDPSGKRMRDGEPIGYAMRGHGDFKLNPVIGIQSVLTGNCYGYVNTAGWPSLPANNWEMLADTGSTKMVGFRICGLP